MEFIIKNSHFINRVSVISICGYDRTVLLDLDIKGREYEYSVPFDQFREAIREVREGATYGSVYNRRVRPYPYN